MKNIGAYSLFFAVVLFLQIFLLNSITTSVYFAPMLYIICIIMLPLDMSQIKILLFGLVLGLLMDTAMGIRALNVVATLPVAFFRRPILHYVAGFNDPTMEEGVPTVKKMGVLRFHRYIIAMVALHSVLFFGFEWLSLDNLGFLALRILCSTLATLALVYLMIILFTAKLGTK